MIFFYIENHWLLTVYLEFLTSKHFGLCIYLIFATVGRFHTNLRLLPLLLSLMPVGLPSKLAKMPDQKFDKHFFAHSDTLNRENREKRFLLDIMHPIISFYIFCTFFVHFLHFIPPSYIYSYDNIGRIT